MINIAKLLKNIPKGFELYSPLFGEVKFKYINGSKFGIVVEDSEECSRSFDKYGRYFTIYNNAECLLFPSKDCRTWKRWKLPVEPKFKVGDEIKTGNTIETIAEIGHAIRSYYCESGRTISFENQDLWHLAPKPHYDIANFQPKQWVLVRQGDVCAWRLDIFSNLKEGTVCQFECVGNSMVQCIPFNEETKHLLGTTDMPSEEYINW